MKKIVALAMALCMALCCVSAMAEAKTYAIGVNQLVQHEALDAATQGFIDALTEKLGDQVTFDVQNASGDTATCATIANGFVSNGVDLIMANATPALQATIAATADIPVLGTSVTAYDVALDITDWKGYTEMNVSGTSDLPPLDQQAAMVKELFPEAKTVALLYCSAEANSEYQVKVMETELAALGMTTERFAFADSNDIASVAEQATACDVIYIPTDNTAASCTETIANVLVPAKKPVIAGEEGICRGCGVATLTISYYDIGYKTGEMAYDILVNGADVSTMEIAFAPQFVKKYNPVMAEDLGVTIPEGYEALVIE
ncbi:MAG: ABC transporter substrate-binding protein [Eubacteriales bacterium]|nr:ABC transporter substrate-binding protein [Eubacteriales bacterium]